MELEEIIRAYVESDSGGARTLAMARLRKELYMGLVPGKELSNYEFKDLPVGAIVRPKGGSEGEFCKFSSTHWSKWKDYGVQGPSGDESEGCLIDWFLVEILP